MKIMGHIEDMEDKVKASLVSKDSPYQFRIDCML